MSNKINLTSHVTNSDLDSELQINTTLITVLGIIVTNGSFSTPEYYIRRKGKGKKK